MTSVAVQRVGGVSVAALVLVLALCTSAAAHDGSRWGPKFTAESYSPEGVDWSSLISACRAAGHHEKRLFNFFLRLAFHDGGALDHDACLKGDLVRCGGLDGSVFLSKEEIVREENAHDGLSDITYRVIRRIASFYDASVADTLAVCSAVAVQELSGHRLELFSRQSGKPNFLVGRLDSKHTAPVHSLPPANMTAPAFADFWGTLGLTVEEGVALLGSHGLLELQGCRDGPRPADKCDPDREDCTHIRMYTWQNHYYKDMCTPSVKIQEVPFKPDTPVKDLSDSEYRALQKTTKCRWTSTYHRQRALDELADERKGLQEEHEPAGPTMTKVTWENKGCGRRPELCQHPAEWEHTVNDAFLAQACQGKAPNKPKTNAIKQAMRRFHDQDAWDRVFVRAWLKILNSHSRFDGGEGLPINGKECTSAYVVDETCRQKEGGSPQCQSCTGLKPCHRCCVCPTAFKMDGKARKPGSTLQRLHVPTA